MRGCRFHDIFSTKNITGGVPKSRSPPRDISSMGHSDPASSDQTKGKENQGPQSLHNKKSRITVVWELVPGVMAAKCMINKFCYF